MKTNSFYQKIKDSFSDFLNNSFHSSDSYASSNEEKTDFFRSFIAKDKIISIKIVDSSTISRSYFERSFTEYIVQVSTVDFQYFLKRRYSSFQKLNANLSPIFSPLPQFPKKVIFQSSLSSQIISSRIRLINQFLSEIIDYSIPANVKQKVFDFFEIYQHYIERGISEVEENDAVSFTDQFLIQSIKKLNERPKNSLHVLVTLRKSLLQRKRKIPFQLVKLIISGFENKKGLVSFTLKNQNTIVQLEGLKLLNSLFSLEENRQCDNFLKAFQKQTIKSMRIENDEQLQQNSEFKLQYFKLLLTYENIRQDNSLQNTIKDSILNQFQKWKMYSSLTI